MDDSQRNSYVLKISQILQNDNISPDEQNPKILEKYYNFALNELKIPVITYGPGDPHEAHTIDEKVSFDEFVKGIEILKKSLHHLKRLHDRKK